MVGRIILTENPIVFVLSVRMARDLADIGVVSPRPEPKPAPEYTAWKPTPGDETPPRFERIEE